MLTAKQPMLLWAVSGPPATTLAGVPLLPAAMPRGDPGPYHRDARWSGRTQIGLYFALADRTQDARPSSPAGSRPITTLPAPPASDGHPAGDLHCRPRGHHCPRRLHCVLRSPRTCTSWQVGENTMTPPGGARGSDRHPGMGLQPGAVPAKAPIVVVRGTRLDIEAVRATTKTQHPVTRRSTSGRRTDD